MQDSDASAAGTRREQLDRIIFSAEGPVSRLYDVILMLTVALSVMVVMLDSVEAIHHEHGALLYGIEWTFTILFTVDYAARLWCVRFPLRYVLSFFGWVDLLGVVPTYLSLFFPGSHYLVAIRFLRVLRIFRVLRLSSYLAESRILVEALRASSRRIVVFLLVVLTLIVVLGSLMYVIEGPQNGFTSIPRSIYWAVVTLTTVGYGDISPGTALGQALAALVMILGYSLIVVPTGIVTLAVSSPPAPRLSQDRTCPACRAGGHAADARYCRHCGTALGTARLQRT